MEHDYRSLPPPNAHGARLIASLNEIVVEIFVQLEWMWADSHSLPVYAISVKVLGRAAENFPWIRR